MYSPNSLGTDSPTGHPASPVTYTTDSALPAVTDEMLQGALQHIRPYTVCILKTGPSFQEPGPARENWVADLIWEHGKRNYALYLAGLKRIVCSLVAASPGPALWLTKSSARSSSATSRR